MARFEFPLLSLLQLRRMLEHQQYLALQRANQMVAASQQRISSATAAMRVSRNAWMEEAASTLSSAELQFMRTCEHNCGLAIAQAQQEHKVLVAKATAERQSYMNRKQQTEVLQHLYDNALETWRTEEARRDQQKIDDLFLMRRDSIQRGRFISELSNPTDRVNTPTSSSATVVS